MERTLIILKPDTIQRRLAGEVISRFERKGLTIAGMRLMQISPELAERHYGVHKERPFYPGLLKFITSGPVVVLAIDGDDAIGICRKMMGTTFGMDAEPGTIRGDYGCTKTYNLVHGSDSVETASFEIPLYFKDDELVDYSLDDARWTSDND